MNRVSMLRGCVAILFALASACASSPKDSRTEQLVYPLPPEEPRILYVTSHRGEGDFRKPSFLDRLFGKPPDAGLYKPNDVFVRDGRVYITLAGRQSVIILDLKKESVSYLGESGRGALKLPMGIAVDSDGTVYVADAKLKRVMVYGSDGSVKATIGKKDEFVNPIGVALNDQLRRVYVADTRAHVVKAYNLDGESLFQFGRAGAKDGEFSFPTYLAVDRRTNNLYVVDTNNFRIQVFDADGRFLRKFGHVGDGPGMFSRPKGIGIDSEGHVYVVDAAFNNFQVFDGVGRILMSVGNLGTRPGSFQLPAGLFVDDQDKVYVVDSVNRRVQVFQYLSERWKRENPEEYKKYLLPAGLK